VKIAIVTVQVPFISGGAELHTRNLAQALISAGHDVDVVTMPFWFNPPSLLREYEDRWAREDMSVYLSGTIDRVICLKYPSYFVRHPRKSIWLLHPLSSMYDFYDTSYGATSSDKEAAAFRRELLIRDRQAFEDVERRFTVSHYLADKVHEIVGVNFQPLYHPPPDPHVYRCEGSYPFIFAPSRLEEQKRQDVLIQAMQYVDPAIHLVLAGTGGQLANCIRLAAECGVSDRIIFAGDLDRSKIASYYANCLGVYFGPFSEPYGYVTLEAMLSSKPVITCTDSGCPTEFVQDSVNGRVVEPLPGAVADAINALWADRSEARNMGRAGRAIYEEHAFSWANVAAALVD
jgi:glycosyltransferase involved in cell wall biosynthesis